MIKKNKNWNFLTNYVKYFFFFHFGFKYWRRFHQMAVKLLLKKFNILRLEYKNDSIPKNKKKVENNVKKKCIKLT